MVGLSIWRFVTFSSGNSVFLVFFSLSPSLPSFPFSYSLSPSFPPPSLPAVFLFSSLPPYPPFHSFFPPSSFSFLPSLPFPLFLVSLCSDNQLPLVHLLCFLKDCWKLFIHCPYTSCLFFFLQRHTF